MHVGLFIPCYIDQFYPDVGFATLEVLERHGLQVSFPQEQTCCGQPLANTGCQAEAQPFAEKFLHVFRQYDYVVAPSGSCVAMVREHYDRYFPDASDFSRLRSRTFELCEFLVDVLNVTSWEGSFPHRVGMHQSCHGLRELRLGECTERMRPSFNKPRQLLQMIDGLELTELTRPDECCGFGGTFAVAEEAVSCRMGLDRIDDHERAGTEVLTAVDMSCLMHLAGLIGRVRSPIRVMHIAEILAGREVGR